MSVQIPQKLSENIIFFLWNLEYKNSYIKNFFGQYNSQNNSVGKSVWKTKCSCGFRNIKSSSGISLLQTNINLFKPSIP